MGLVSELRRRNVLRMVVLYVVAAWLIMQVAEVLIGLAKLPDWIGTTTLGLLAVGFPIALVFSWFYELTPEGISLEKDVEPGESITHVTGRRIDFLVISLLCAAVILFAYDKWWMPEPPDRSVAVLPFVNISGDPDNEYFSDGLTETLLNALAQLPDLKVSARTSAFFFKDQDIDIREVAEKLGVSNVLEGSVQRDGSKIRIVAQLIEAETGFHLWSNTYNREMSDIFAVQDDIANSVALAMQVTLAGDTSQGGAKIETVGTNNVAAYDKYLKGLQQKNAGGFVNLSLAESSFAEALALDPGFYEARLQLAYTYLHQLDFGLITNAEVSERVKPLIERLLDEQPDYGRVLAAALSASILSNDSGALAFGSPDIETALADLAAAIEQTPSDSGLYRELILLLGIAGRNEEKLEWVARGLALDPLNRSFHHHRIVTLIGLGELDEAEARYASLIGSGSIIWDTSAWRRKQYTEWFAIWREGIDVDPLDHETWALLAINLYTFGLMDEGDKYLQRAIEIAPDKPLVRGTKLHQLMLLDDHSGVAELSEAMLRDDIDNRRGAHWFAVMAFVSAMSELDRLDEALAVLEELQPGVLSSEFQPDDIKEMAFQYHVVLALAQLQSQVETLAMLDAVEPHWNESFPYWREYPGIVAQIAMARGQKAAAVELMIEYLDRELARHSDLDYPHQFQYIFSYKELTRESSIAERLSEIDSEAKKGGEEIWAYIVENDLQL